MSLRVRTGLFDNGEMWVRIDNPHGRESFTFAGPIAMMEELGQKLLADARAARELTSKPHETLQ